MKIFKWLWTIILFIGGLFAIGSMKKNIAVKPLKKAIKSNKKKEVEIEKTIIDLQEDKAANKVEITKLKRKLARTKKEIDKMEVAYTEDNVDDAVKFLRKFASE